MRIGKRRSFCNAIIHNRLMIGRCRTDVHILLRLSGKQPVIPFHLLRNKSDKIAYHIKIHSGYLLCNLLFLADIGNNLLYLPVQYIPTASPVQKIQLPALFHQKSGNRHTDRSCSSNKKCSHAITSLSLCLFTS